ncbi:MAG: UDP-N-acetylmuramoyl-L-alanine--D-glutamate ligase, partial [Monoglobales bacterium]
GKTTTTTLISEMLKKEGYSCHIGGNIGNPLIAEIEKISEKDKVVLELSSFQLFTMGKSPGIAVITNISPNHLDWHKGYDEYIESKKNIMKFQGENDILVTNSANEIANAIGREAKGEHRDFSSKGDALVHLRNGAIFYGDDKVIDAADIKIPGEHNVENYMAAIAAMHGLVSNETIKYVARNFSGVEHRIEFVREIGGVRFYNDSIASSPSRTIAALNSFENKIILIAGGYDKKIPFDELGKKINEKVKELILVGDTARKIKKAVLAAGNEANITVCKEFEQAVLKAYNKAEKGDVVILSPACASFDLFKNFMSRGETFKNIVNSIKGE